MSGLERLQRNEYGATLREGEAFEPPPGKRTLVQQAYGAGGSLAWADGDPVPAAAPTAQPTSGGGPGQPAAPAEAAAPQFVVTNHSFRAAGRKAAAGQPPDAVVDSGGFTGTATVAPGPGVTAADWSVGYLQTLHLTERVFVYESRGGSDYQTYSIRFGPAMDQDSGTSPAVPWYQPHSQLGAAGTTVSITDIPNFSWPTRSPDGNGTLRRMRGQENFTSWLVARHNTNNTVVQLKWASWRVQWDGVWSPDYNTFSGGSSAVSDLGSGAHGSPTTSGAAANTQGTAGTWSQPGQPEQRPGRRADAGGAAGGEPGAAPGAEAPSAVA